MSSRIRQEHRSVDAQSRPVRRGRPGGGSRSTAGLAEIRRSLYNLLARSIPLDQLCHQTELLLSDALGMDARLHLPQTISHEQWQYRSIGPEVDAEADPGDQLMPEQLLDATDSQEHGPASPPLSFYWSMAAATTDAALGESDWAFHGADAADDQQAGDGRGPTLLPVALGRKSIALLSLSVADKGSLCPWQRKFLNDMLPSVALAIRHCLQHQRQRKGLRTLATRLRAMRTLKHLRLAAQRPDVSDRQLAADLHSIMSAALCPADPRILLRVRIGRAVSADAGFRPSRLAAKAEFMVDGQALGDVQTLLAPVAPKATGRCPAVEISSHLRSVLLVEAAEEISAGLLERQLCRQNDLAAEEECRRLARDLHDKVGPALTGISLLAHSLSQRLAGQHPELASIAADLSRTASSAVRDVRQLSHRRSRQGEPSGSAQQVLREIAARTRRQYGLECQLELSDEAAGLKEPTLLENISAIAQEAIVNAVRHGHADVVKLRLQRRRERLIFSIADDGCGFETCKQRQAGGIGIDNIRQRAADLGGRLSIQAHPGKGTTLYCRFPAQNFFAEAGDSSLWRP